MCIARHQAVTDRISYPYCSVLPLNEKRDLSHSKGALIGNNRKINFKEGRMSDNVLICPQLTILKQNRPVYLARRDAYFEAAVDALKKERIRRVQYWKRRVIRRYCFCCGWHDCMRGLVFEVPM